jgi:sigma-B regulation protein RsbQ
LTPVRLRNNVTVSGLQDGQPMVFAHGFGCDQAMWRHVAPRFEDTHRVVLFDHVGAGASDPTDYDPQRYGSLAGYADDVVSLCRELGLEDVVFVGHSVSAMIGVLAANADPERFASVVLVAPSPRYIDDAGYVGGFTREDIEGLLETMETDYLGWSSQMAPMIVGNAEQPELGEELAASFCRTDPEIARDFARVTFLSDNRRDLTQLQARTLILQCSDDLLAPQAVGRYVHEQVAGSELVVLDATGHCPNLSAPDETAAAIHTFLQSR